MSDQLIKSVAEMFSIPVGAIVFVIIFVVCWWVWVRTGTTSVLTNRIWRLMIGDLAKDDDLGKALDQHLMLMAIRFHLFPRVKNTREAEAVVSWSDANDEEIGAVAKCGPFFNVSELRVNNESLPGKGGMAARVVFSAGLLLVAVAAGMSMIPHEVIVQYKPTGQYFWLAKDRARGVLSHERLTNEQCVKREYGENAPEADVRDAICDLLSKPEEVEKHFAILPLQRFALLVVLLAFGFPGVNVWRNFAQAINAMALVKRLKERGERGALATGA